MGPQIIQVTRSDKNRADRISASFCSLEAKPAGAVRIRKDTVAKERKTEVNSLIKAERYVVARNKSQISFIIISTSRCINKTLNKQKLSSVLDAFQLTLAIMRSF